LRAGAPKPPGLPQPQGAPQQQPGAQQQQQAMANAPTPPQNTNPNGVQSPPQPKPQRNPFAQPMTAGSSIAEATRGAARSGMGGFGGDYGASPTGPRGRVGSNLDVLSDTQGVDFGPYLNRVIQNVRDNWYTLVPESAKAPLYKKGKVSIEFAILPDGKIAGMRVTGPSGDVSLDRAAWGGISLSNPFPPLPEQFKGPYLALRFHFFYNPDPGEMQ
jgi:TonB family protein